MGLHQVQAHGDGFGRLPRPFGLFARLRPPAFQQTRGRDALPKPSRAGWRLPLAPLSTALCGGAFATPEKGRCPADRRRQGGAVLVREPGPASKLARARCRSACSTQVASPRPDLSMLLLASESDALPAPIGFGRHPPDMRPSGMSESRRHKPGDATRTTICLSSCSWPGWS